MSGRLGTGGVLFADVEMFDGALGRDRVLMDGPRGVTRCLLDDAFKAGESGKNLGFDVLINVCKSAVFNMTAIDCVHLGSCGIYYPEYR